jgi:hypothetical protein
MGEDIGVIVNERKIKMRTFTAYIEWDPETKLYVSIVPGIPGAHTQEPFLTNSTAI